MALTELRSDEDNLTARLTAVRADLALRNAQSRELPALAERVAAMRNGGPYRSEDFSKLERQLDEARAARGERARLRIEEAELLREAERLRGQLEENGIRKVSLPILENAMIATPCPESWADMQGDSDVRFCQGCAKNVYNLSMMSREEAEAVLGIANGKDICIRLYRRTDGTVITQDCPVGLSNQRFWRRTKGIAAAGLIAGALGLAYYNYVAGRCAVDKSTGTQGVVTSLAPG
ncbi:MAG: hypothetical protein ABI421_00565 [Polyangiaceae bacterium]